MKRFLDKLGMIGDKLGMTGDKLEIPYRRG